MRPLAVGGIVGAVVLAAILAAVAFLVYRLRCTRTDAATRGTRDFVEMSGSANSSSDNAGGARKVFGDSMAGQSPFASGSSNPVTPPFARHYSAPIVSKSVAAAGGESARCSSGIGSCSGSNGVHQSLRMQSRQFTETVDSRHQVLSMQASGNSSFSLMGGRSGMEPFSARWGGTPAEFIKV